MMEWVTEEQARELNLEKERAKKTEACPFCSKMFDTHHALTAHLRWHSSDIDNMVYGVIVKSAGPLRVSTIQKLSGANFSVKNAVTRLVRSGKIHRVAEGFTNRRTVPTTVKKAVEPRNTFELPEVITNSISEDRMNRLIVGNLKRLQPEVYNAIVNDIIENMVRYAMGMAEIS